MTELHDLLHAPGPFASLVMATPSATEDAPSQLHIRWYNARRELDEAGFPSEELELLDDEIADLHHGGGAALVLIRGVGGPTFAEFLDDAVDLDLVAVDAVAHLGPLLESQQRALPHLMVVTDRTGADIVCIGDDGQGDPEVVGVEGETLHVQRSKPGGWSQRRFQQRAENVWESNAGEVAEQVADLARQTDARLITIAGDVRAVGFLVEHLPSDVHDLVRVLDGQSEELIAEETVRAVADLVARDTRATLQRFAEAAGHENAVHGAQTTLRALSNGQVDTLLVHDDPADQRRALFDPAGSWCALDEHDKTSPPPLDHPSDGRLVDVAIRSALLGGASVRFVPKHGGPDEQVGAILRW